MKFDISEKKFQSLAEEKPVMIQLMAKVNTACSPLELYSSLDKKCAYLLESVEKEKRHARFSFVGADPDAVVTIKNRMVSLDYQKRTGLIKFIESSLSEVCNFDPGGRKGRLRDGYDTMDALRSAFAASGVKFVGKGFDRQTFMGGAIGFCAYDMVYDCWLEIPAKESQVPDAQFALTTKTAVFDHMTGETYIVMTPLVAGGDDAREVYRAAEEEAERLAYIMESARPCIAEKKRPVQIICNMEKNEYEDAVRIAKKHIVDGDIFQVVLSRRYEITTDQTPVELYTVLRSVNPSPYMYLFEFNGTGIIGASPETLLSVHDRKVIINPIAGTCPRGKTQEEDETFAKEMLGSEKERAEHVMLVDLGRNDVRMVSEGGSVKVEDFMSVLKYSHVQHIESTVSGMLREECDQFDATRAIFPAGTLTGAPKIRAMEIIHDLEKDARGIYGGGVGYYSWNGDADFAIVIRTIIKNGRKAVVQAGAGIVADSDPEYEYNETERKMAAMIKAIGGHQT
ncbi:MAG: anthranilate synthase component I [Candidatus Methanoperedens sp.]|nr:anthranilate synthase component I [Candidatus Methanoperedens sp.]MCZ7361196.1 anthranilate synthase component I [Candidatus Methanoperedens sp.]HLB71618.1 anthranilate synthase component I [Candidatus Methanoperedens sp.]